MFINYNPEFDIRMAITIRYEYLTIDSYSYDCFIVYSMHKNAVHSVFKTNDGYYYSRTFS